MHVNDYDNPSVFKLCYHIIPVEMNTQILLSREEALIQVVKLIVVLH